MGEKVKDVPYIVHEQDMARMQLANRRLWIALLLAMLIIAGSWIGFFIYESQYEDVYQTQTVDQEADGDGYNQFIGGDYYGDATENNNNDEAPGA